MGGREGEASKQGRIMMKEQVSSVAILGSFKQHYEDVLKSLGTFAQAGICVTTPPDTGLLKPGIPFVRFESDDAEWSDEMVQVVALHRIFRADYIFVVVPDGYVGRSTCYEIGRAIQAKKTIYFSERPEDLPLMIPADCICSAQALAEQICKDDFIPVPLHHDVSDKVCGLEQDLLCGQYQDI